MRTVRSLVVPFIPLFLFWVMLNGSTDADTLFIGVVVSLIIALLFRTSLSPFTELHFTPRAAKAALGFFIFFVGELVKANIRLARVVLSPSLPIKPGFVKVRTRLKSRMGRLLLANSITLTPGTLTVELEGEWLYVHWVTVETTDTELASQQIVAGFENYLEVMYG